MAVAAVKFTHDGEVLTIETATYEDGSIAVLAVDADGLPYATLSVRMPDGKPPDGVFYLKTWSENAGVARSFMESGLIERAIWPVAWSGFITAQAWKFREEA